MEVFRLCRRAFAEPLSGKGAALRGGRWNSPGIELIYTAANRSLAMAEVAVHFTLATLPADYLMMTIVAPDDISIDTLAMKSLPANWNAFPYPPACQAFGDRFVNTNKFCLLRVPSAVTQGDFNILINPKHPEFLRVKVKGTVKFPFDNRLFRA